MNVPKDVDPRQHVVTLLRSVGLGRSEAQRLVEDELEITPLTGFKNLTKLLEGRYSEGGEWIEASAECKAAGAKFVAIMLWDGVNGSAPEALTPEEKELVLVRSLDVTVRAGFPGRVATYTKNKRQLLAVLKVFQPTVKSPDFKSGVKNSDPEKTRRRIAAVADILGMAAVFTEGE